MPIFLITNIDHGGRRSRPWQVGAGYGGPEAQKIAIDLLYQRRKVRFHESNGIIFQIAAG